jgi:hypothetical protein
MRVAWAVLIAGCGFQAQPARDENPTAAFPDALAFDSSTCPPSYTTTLTGSSSRYRLLVESHPAWEQSDACAGDMPGATHLAVLDTLEEIRAAAALISAAPTLANSAAWIGAVQLRTAPLTNQAWFWFDGTPLTGNWNSGEPNDGGGGETDHREQFVKLQKARTYFIDQNGSEGDGALCECDGKPIARIALDAIAASR